MLVFGIGFLVGLLSGGYVVYRFGDKFKAVFSGTKA